MNPAFAPVVPGWCGMIPAHPEFIGRRLDRHFIHGMDAWLRAAMLESQQTLGESWTDRYCNASVWRFLIAPAVCGEQAHAGILMSCNDSAGRYFPFIIAAALEPAWSAHAVLVDRFGWFKHIERVARDALGHDLPPEAIDEQLSCNPLPPLGEKIDSALQAAEALKGLLNSSTPPASSVHLPGLSSCLDAASIWGAWTLFEPLVQRSLWWRETGRSSCEALRFDGMPGDQDYVRLLAPISAAAAAATPLPCTP